MIAWRVWVIEILVSGFNYFVLMNKIYQPRWGELKAHRIGMITRMVYLFIAAYILLAILKNYSTFDLFVIGIWWLLLTLAFEWGGSFIIRRPVKEILEGWHIEKGYMWPYVLATYTFSPLIVGLVLHPGQ